MARLREVLNLFPIKSFFFTCLDYKSFENTMEKGEILVKSNFSFSHTVFYPIVELSDIFIKYEIVVCKLFQFGRVLNMSSVGKGLNPFCQSTDQIFCDR